MKASPKVILNPQPTPFVANLNEYILTSQEVWNLEDASDALKLDWNEGTITHSVVIDAISEFLSRFGATNWYPDVSCRQVVGALSSRLGIPSGDILVFPGSDVALDCLVRTFVMQGDEAILLTPTYDNFRIYIESCGANVHQISLSDTLSFNVQEFIDKVDDLTQNPRILYLVNPNNPVGYLISIDEIKKLLTHFNNSIVIVDEAYAEFAGVSSLPLVEEFPNLFVARSFSKAFALAGLRLGYIASQAANLRHVNKIRNPKNISMIAQVGAKAILARYDLVERYVDEIVQARSWFIQTMRSLGASPYESYGNFVLIRVPEPLEAIKELAAFRVYARDRSYMAGLEGMIRMTIGTRAQMERVVQAFKQMSPRIWRKL